MHIRLHQIDAFTSEVFRGNPAAVCPLEAWLPDALLQSIAEENNLSETAFYVEDGGRCHLRWFTPTREVDLCGHATLAAAHVWFETKAPHVTRLTFESRSGPLPVTRDDGLLTLDFPALEVLACDVPPGLIEALGARPVACFHAMDYLAVFDNEEEILALSPDFRLLKSFDLRGVIVTAPGHDIDFVSRFFAPNYGIDEDPVTGSAHCMLAPYWAGRLGKSTLDARQLSKRGGQILCRVEGTRVFLSGKTVAYMVGTIHLEGV